LATPMRMCAKARPPRIIAKGPVIITSHALQNPNQHEAKLTTEVVPRTRDARA
jgi:hypothetical protein